MPATATLDSLPVEILVHICELLDHEYISDVLAFALTSKFHYSAAATLLLRTIKFDVLSASQLAREVQEYHATLQRSTGFRHVRRLIVRGVPPIKKYKNFNNPRFQREKRTLSAKERGYDDDTFSDRSDFDYYEYPLDDHALVHDINESWMPLADLIPQLPSLSDLIYRCLTQFPPCILEALHECQPRCRLHIGIFHLRSMNCPNIDPYELRLASSPCLYSIGFLCKEYYLTRRYRAMTAPHDFNSEASMHLVAGLAPNLKEARWFSTRSRLGRSYQEIRKQMPAEIDSRQSSRGSLRCLQYSGAESISKRTVASWIACIDFSTLKVLKLDQVVDQEALELLANECNFSSLTNVALRIRKDGVSTQDTAYQFLRRLPPLSKLELLGDSFTNLENGWPRIDLGCFIDHHGATLRELRLPASRLYPLSQESIKLLRDSCPLLEDLRVTLKRSRGDPHEVKTYMILGSMQQLKKLHIILDASDPHVRMAADPISPNDSSFNEFDQEFFHEHSPMFPELTFHGLRRQPRNGHVRDALINSALDEKLARSIYNAISSGKPAASLPLEKMKVEVIGAGHFGLGQMSMALHDVVGALSTPWLIRRNPRDDCPHDLIAIDIYQQLRPNMGRPIGRDVEPIFHRLWPAKDKGGNWRKEWHSFPLAVVI